jgi:hypothetical protein
MASPLAGPWCNKAGTEGWRVHPPLLVPEAGIPTQENLNLKRIMVQAKQGLFVAAPSFRLAKRLIRVTVLSPPAL